MTASRIYTRREGALMDTGDGGLPRDRRVFVVHGRDNAARLAMFAFLRAIDLRPTEWPEAVASPFIGHVLDVALGEAQAIVVLMTPDDMAYLRADYAAGTDDPDVRPQGQARPNVLFEAGMAMGRDPARTLDCDLVRVKDRTCWEDWPGADVEGGRLTSQRPGLAPKRLCLADTPGSPATRRGTARRRGR